MRYRGFNIVQKQFGGPGFDVRIGVGATLFSTDNMTRAKTICDALITLRVVHKRLGPLLKDLDLRLDGRERE